MKVIIQYLHCTHAYLPPEAGNQQHELSPISRSTTTGSHQWRRIPWFGLTLSLKPALLFYGNNHPGVARAVANTIKGRDSRLWRDPVFSSRSNFLISDGFEIKFMPTQVVLNSEFGIECCYIYTPPRYASEQRHPAWRALFSLFSPLARSSRQVLGGHEYRSNNMQPILELEDRSFSWGWTSFW